MPHQDSKTCLRPDCRFSPQPFMSDAGTLSVDAYCSTACRTWTEAAVVVARAPFSPVIERQSERLFLVAQLLNLRDHPADYDEEVTAQCQTWTS